MVVSIKTKPLENACPFLEKDSVALGGVFRCILCLLFFVVFVITDTGFGGFIFKQEVDIAFHTLCLCGTGHMFTFVGQYNGCDFQFHFAVGFPGIILCELECLCFSAHCPLIDTMTDVYNYYA